MRRDNPSHARTSAAMLVAIAACCLSAPAQDTQPTQPVEIEVVNEKHGFRFKIPAKFQPMPSLSAPGGMLHAFVLLDDSPGEGVPTIVQIQRMPRGVSLQGMGGLSLRKGLIPGGGVRMETRKWQGRDVTAMVWALPMEGKSFRTVSVEIPLKSQSIMVMVSGDGSRKAELDGYVAGILNSLQGQAATTSTAPGPAGPAISARLPKVLLLLMVLAAAALIVSVIVVIVIVVATRSKRSRPGPPTLPPSGQDSA